METIRFVDRIREIMVVDGDPTDTSVVDIKMAAEYGSRLRSSQISINRTKVNLQIASGWLVAGGLNRVGLSMRVR